MAKKLTILIMLIALVFPALKAEEQKREMRAAWLATVSNIDWPSERGTGAAVIARQKQSLIDYLDGFANTNMNAVCIQVRSMCDAMYQSSYEPWSSYLTGTRGTNPGWDPLYNVPLSRNNDRYSLPHLHIPQNKRNSLVHTLRVLLQQMVLLP